MDDEGCAGAVVLAIGAVLLIFAAGYVFHLGWKLAGH